MRLRNSKMSNFADGMLTAFDLRGDYMHPILRDVIKKKKKQKRSWADLSEYKQVLEGYSKKAFQIEKKG